MDYVASRRTMIEQKGFGMSMAQGSSMHPLFWAGCHCVTITPIVGDPKLGDLLMFRDVRGGREKNIVHRLVEIIQEGEQRVYITRGDNCLGTERVRWDMIIGRVTEVHRLSGFRPWYIIPARRFTVDDRAYLRYSRVWAATWPVRRVYYLIRAHANGLRVRIMSLFRREKQ